MLISQPREDHKPLALAPILYTVPHQKQQVPLRKALLQHANLLNDPILAGSEDLSGNIIIVSLEQWEVT